jgi:hypothetical protein
MFAPIQEHELILQIRQTLIQFETIQFKIIHQRERIPPLELTLLPEAIAQHPHVRTAQVVEVLAVAVVVLAAVAEAVAVDVDKRAINSLQYML